MRAYNVWGEVWKREWKMTFLGLKQGLDLEYRAAHPHQDFPEAPPPPGRGVLHKIYEKAPDMSIA